MAKNNFYKAIKPSLNICKMLGILPFSYENDKIVLLKRTSTYNLLLLILFMSLGLKIIMAVFQQNIVEAITDMTLIAGSQLQFIVTLLKGVLGKETWLDFANAILRTDELFDEMGIQLPDGKLKIKTYSGLMSIIGFVGFGLSVQVYLNTLGSYMEYIYWYSCVLFTSVLSSHTGLYIVRIRDCFKAVNSVLKERVYAENGGGFQMHLKDSLCSACIAHHSLTKIMRKFNGCFGILLLTIFTTSFLMTITILLESYKAIKRQDIITLVSNMVFFVAHVMTNVYLCHLCETTVDEVTDNTFSLFKISFNDQFSG